MIRASVGSDGGHWIWLMEGAVADKESWLVDDCWILFMEGVHFVDGGVMIWLMGDIGSVC